MTAALAHLATQLVRAPLPFAFAYLADPLRLGRWSLGCMATRPAGTPGLFAGTSLYDGSEGTFRIEAEPARQLIDFLVGPADALVHRISIRLAEGAPLGYPSPSCLVMLSAWRPHDMAEERWARLCASHEAEIFLIKAQIETRFAAERRRGKEQFMNPVVIAVAITGSVPRKKDNPAVPISPAEQIESTQAAFEAGATLVHIHVRNDDESPSSDPERFAAVQAGVLKHCPGMIVQFSTGGRGRDPSARGSALHLRPDMASLSTGSVNFPTIVYENHTTLVLDLATKMKSFGVLPEIEIFDLSHLHGARRLVEQGLLDGRAHVQVVMGVQNALPAEEHLLDLLLGELKRILPQASWTAAGIGRHQATVMGWALARGADAVRTGLEDNIRVSKDRLAGSNAELVTLAAETIATHGRRVATPQEARALLGLAG